MIEKITGQERTVGTKSQRAGEAGKRSKRTKQKKGADRRERQ